MNEQLCEYGCGNIAMYTLKNGKLCCQSHYNKCPAIKIKNSRGVLKAYQDGRLNAKNNYQNLSQETKDRMAWARGKCLIKPEDLKNKKEIHLDTLMRMISNNIIDLKYKCSICGNEGMWNGKPLKLELHHIDGNHRNNDVNNLTFLCPNCHTQTDTYRNKGTSRWLKDNQILDFLNTNLPLYHNNINELLDNIKVKNQSYVYRKYIDFYQSGLITTECEISHT